MTVDKCLRVDDVVTMVEYDWDNLEVAKKVA